MPGYGTQGKKTKENETLFTDKPKEEVPYQLAAPTTSDKQNALAAKAQAAEAFSKKEWEAPKAPSKEAGLYDTIMKSISPSSAVSPDTAEDKAADAAEAMRLENKSAAQAALRERYRKEQQGGK